MGSVPIPTRCAARPLVGGLVVPQISVVLRDGRPVLGAVHSNKAMRCITEFRCQICGDALDRPLVVLVSDEGLAERYSSEAALHPECAAYSERARPFLAGQMATYRAPDRHIGAECSEPGCDCGGWVESDPGRPSRRGDEAGQWWAVWLDDYAVTVYESGVVHGLSWKHLTPRRVRPVRRETAGVRP